MKVFCPKLPDMESYYVSAEHFAKVYRIPLEISEEILAETVDGNLERLRKKFKEKRRDAVKKFWMDGGGPATEMLWPNDEKATQNQILGKEILPRLNAYGQSRYGHANNLFATPSIKFSQEIREFLIENGLIKN